MSAGSIGELYCAHVRIIFGLTMTCSILNQKLPGRWRRVPLVADFGVCGAAPESTPAHMRSRHCSGSCT